MAKERWPGRTARIFCLFALNLILLAYIVAARWPSPPGGSRPMQCAPTCLGMPAEPADNAHASATPAGQPSAKW